MHAQRSEARSGDVGLRHGRRNGESKRRRGSWQLADFLGLPGTLAVFALMVHTVLNAVLRKTSVGPLEGTLEFGGYWYMPLIALLGLGWAQQRGEHIEARLVFDRAPRAVQRDYQLLANLATLLLCLGFAVFGWFEAIEKMEIGATAGVSGITVWPAYFLAPLGFVLMVIAITTNTVKLLRGRLDPHQRRRDQGEGTEREGPTREAEPRTGEPAAGTVAVARVREGTARGRLLWRAVPLALLIASGVGMWLDIPREVVGVLGLIMMFTLMALKLPVGAAMAIPGALGIWAVVGWNAAEGVFHRMPYDSVASWSLSVLPMFIIMGILLAKSGLTEKLYGVARQWVGWLPGGLAVGTNIAGAGLASISGTTFGAAYALGRAGVPEMLKAGYDRRLAVGSVLASGTLAHLIPPSIFLLIYAGIAETPVGPQLLAGLVPGVLLAVLYCVGVVGLSVLKPSLAGRGGVRLHTTWGERLKGLLGIWPVPALIGVVLGGLYSGFFTATEVGAVGALGSLIIAAWARRASGLSAAVRESVVSTVASVGALSFLLIGAYVLTRFLSVTGLVTSLVDTVAALGLGRVEFLLLMIVVYLLLGMVMDSLAMMLVTVPLLMPILSSLEISPIWFGVFVVVLCELAVLTPPVGILAFVVHAIVQDPEVNLGQHISLADVFRAVLVLLPIPILLLLMMIWFPDIVLWAEGAGGE